MDKLIDELTIYSRLDANRVLYTFVKFDVSEYFDDCCDEIGTELDAAGIELNYRNHIKEPVIIAADPEIHVEDTVTTELFGINIGAVGDKCALVFGVKLEILNQA